MNPNNRNPLFSTGDFNLTRKIFFAALIAYRLLQKFGGLLKYIAHAKLATMRFFLCIMMFAFILSGYTTAAHAFAPVFKDKGQITNAISCVDCQQDNTGSNDKNDDKAKNGCADCHSCCSGQLAFFPFDSINISIVTAVLTPIYADSLSSNHPLSLLRPPKSLA